MAGRNVIFCPPDVITDGVRVTVRLRKRDRGAPRLAVHRHWNGTIASTRSLRYLALRDR